MTTDKPKSAEPTLKQPTWRQRDYTATATMGSNEAKVLIAPDGVEYGPMFPGTADGLESRIATTHQALLDTVVALAKARDHVEELADAWQRGVISEHDGKGGQRSNRNADVLREIEAALARAKEVRSE